MVHYPDFETVHTKEPVVHKRLVLAVAVVMLILASSVFPFGEPAPQFISDDTGTTLEDFSTGALSSRWWRFGSLQESFTAPDLPDVGPKAMMLKGSADNWYVGGRGMYVGLDAGKYVGIEFWLWGSGPETGKVKIQLFDDDNNTAQIEQDAAFKPLQDDEFEYEMPIDWSGWKKVHIRFDQFHDINPGVGNDIWDPFTLTKSTGLTQLQFIFNAVSKNGTVDTGLGTIRLVKQMGTN